MPAWELLGGACGASQEGSPNPTTPIGTPFSILLCHSYTITYYDCASPCVWLLFSCFLP